MDGQEQTSTISPEFLENIQSAVNSQGVLGQVQVIETENGPVTVLFMEEGADGSNIGGDNITLTVTDGDVTNTGSEDQNSQVQFQYQVQSDEDYTQFLQGNTTEEVITSEAVKEDTVAAVEPVIGLPEQGTIDNLEQKAGESTDTYFITDTGEILKIDSSLLGDTADATLQLQTQDGSYQVLNQLGNVQTTTQVETQQIYSQPSAVENSNVTYIESAPLEYTATKVEEPKVLSYKTTNRQRTNIMRQPVAKSTSSSVLIQPKTVVANQNAKAHTSLFNQSHYKSVQQVNSSGNTTEVVYPKSYQKQTIVFPKVQRETHVSGGTQTGLQSFQRKASQSSQQMITTMMKPQSLLKNTLDKSGPHMNKYNIAQIPGGNISRTIPSKNIYSEQKKVASHIISRPVPIATKQQTDLLSVAMKQADVPEQILTSVSSVPKNTGVPALLKDSVPVPLQADKPLVAEVKEYVQDVELAKPFGESSFTSILATSEVQDTEKQSTEVQQTTLESTSEQTVVAVEMVTKETQISEENAEQPIDELVHNEKEVKENIEEGQSEKAEKAADLKTATVVESDIAKPETPIKQVQVKNIDVFQCNLNICPEENQNMSCCRNKLGNESIKGAIEILKFDESLSTVDEKLKRVWGSSNENDANKVNASVHDIDSGNGLQDDSKQINPSFQDSIKTKGKVHLKNTANYIQERWDRRKHPLISKKVDNNRFKRILKCPKCLFSTSKKQELQQHETKHKADSNAVHFIGPKKDCKKIHSSNSSIQEMDLKISGESGGIFEENDKESVGLPSQQQLRISSGKGNVTEKVAFSRSIANRHVKYLYKCIRCNFTTSNKPELMKHAAEHEAKDPLKESIKCQLCSLMISAKNYGKHIMEMHPSSRFECENCKEIFLNKKNLHIQIGECDLKLRHEGKDNMPYTNHQAMARGIQSSDQGQGTEIGITQQENHVNSNCFVEAYYDSSSEVETIEISDNDSVSDTGKNVNTDIETVVSDADSERSVVILKNMSPDKESVQVVNVSSSSDYSSDGNELDEDQQALSFKHIKENVGKCQGPEWAEKHIVYLNEQVIDELEPVLDIPVCTVELYIDTIDETSLGDNKVIKTSYNCKVCNAQFETHSLTKRHILQRHCKTSKETPIKCSTCDYFTYRWDVMKIHQKTHEGNLKCDFCPAKFKEIGKFQMHNLAHLKDKYQCSLCSKIYTLKQTCREHILVAHPGGKTVASNSSTLDDMNFNLEAIPSDQVSNMTEQSNESERYENETNEKHIKNTTMAKCSEKNGRNLDALMSKSKIVRLLVPELNNGFDFDSNESKTEVRQNASTSFLILNQIPAGFRSKNDNDEVNIKSQKDEAQCIDEYPDKTNIPSDFERTSQRDSKGEGSIQDKQILGENFDSAQVIAVAEQGNYLEEHALYETNHQPKDGQPYLRVEQGDLEDNIFENFINDKATEHGEEMSSTLQSGVLEKNESSDINEHKSRIPEGLEEYLPIVGHYTCGGCGIKFESSEKFERHVHANHTEGLMCNICRKKSTTQIILLNHMFHKHLDGKPFTCPRCKMAFKKLNTYWRHAETHTKCFTCEICERKFKKKSGLTEHMHHHVENKLLCIRCGEIYDTPEELRMHTWKVHSILLHKSKHRRKALLVGKPRRKIETPRKVTQQPSVSEVPEKSSDASVQSEFDILEDAEKASPERASIEELGKDSKESQDSSQMKSIDVPDSDVTIQLFADGTLVTRDKAGTNYSQVKLEDLGLDLSMLEGNTDIELLIVQGDGKEVRATINTSTDVNPTNAPQATQASKSLPVDTAASDESLKSKESPVEKTKTSSAPVNDARPYKCSMCPRTFKFYRTYKCHEIVHSKAITFTCHLCRRLFAREVNLKSHLELHKKKGAMKPTQESINKKGAMKPKQESINIKSRQCQHCNKIYADKTKLRKHIREQHEQKQIPCPICGRLFANESSVQRHAKIHVGPFTCPHCIQIFTEKTDYQEHIQSDHADLVHSCKECDAILPSKKAFISHTITQHSNAEELLEGGVKECPLCEKTFKNQSMLTCHLAVHSKESNHQCPACLRTFKYIHRLEQHIREEHNNEVVFTCCECEEEFIFKAKLDLHLSLYHSGNYQCLTCYEEFHERLQLEEHQFNNHDISFECSKCKSKFETSCKLKHHLKEHTSQNILCDICGTGFEFKPQLRTHLTNEHFQRDRALMLKQYPAMSKVSVEILCDLCGEFFPNKPLYKHHLRDIHYGGDTVAMLKFFPFFEKISDPPEPATCDHCGKVCSSVTQLNFHLRSHIKAKAKGKTKEPNLTDDEQDDAVDLSNIEPREMDKSYRCVQCGAEFSRKASLDKHKSIHQKDEFKEALRELEKEEVARAELEEKEELKAPKATKTKVSGKKPKMTKETIQSPKMTKETIQSPKMTKESIQSPKMTKETIQSPKMTKETIQSPITNKVKSPKRKTKAGGSESSNKRRSSKMHICKVCEEVFNNSEKFIVHMQDDHGDKDFKLDTETTSTPVQKKVKFDLATFTCISCDRPFACRKYLRKHLNRVHSYYCKSESLVKRPSPESTKTASKTLSKKKGKKSKKADDALEQMETEINVKEEDSTADISSFLGKNFNLGKTHKCNIESVKLKQHRCSLCGERFSREATLKKHLILHETSLDFDMKPKEESYSDLQPAIYPCISCGNMYSTALGLIHHNRSKHSDVDEETVLAQIAEVDEKMKSKSPKQKVKEPIKATKRKLETDGDDMREHAKKRRILDQDGKESFNCGTCAVVYYTYKGLLKHEEEMHGASKLESQHSPTKYSNSGRLITKSKKVCEQIQCDKCSRTFLEEKNLKLHIQRVHKVEETVKVLNVIFKCDHCPKEFDMRINLRRHTKMKHNIELAPETPDNSMNTSLDKGKKSMNTSLDKGKKSMNTSLDKGKKSVYHCDVCDQTFSALSSLQHHLISIHDENDENLVDIKQEPVFCQICDLQFATEKTLQVHMRKHTGEKPYKCCLCNKQFISKYQLECHMKKLHTKLFAKKVKCKICLMLFENEKAMWKHKVIHRKPSTDDDQMKIDGKQLNKCDLCEKAFRWKRNLDSHVETYHTNSDPQTCGVCNKVFPDMASVKAHMAEHQKTTDSFTCKICDKSFPKESSLKNHESHLHKTKSSPNSSGLSCDICKESFQTKMKLMEHMLTHTSMMPHKCDVCSASFKQEFRLKAHKLTHKLKKSADKEKSKNLISKVKDDDSRSSKSQVPQQKFKCKKCNKQFNKPWFLKTHITKSHQQKLPLKVALMRSKMMTRSRSSSETSAGTPKADQPLKQKKALTEKTKSSETSAGTPKADQPLKQKKALKEKTKSSETSAGTPKADQPLKQKKALKEKTKSSETSAGTPKADQPLKQKKALKEKTKSSEKNAGTPKADQPLKQKTALKEKTKLKELKKKFFSKGQTKVEKSANFCQKCKLNFINVETYKTHLKAVHGAKDEGKKIAKGVVKNYEKKVPLKAKPKDIKSKKEENSIPEKKIMLKASQSVKKKKIEAVKGKEKIIGHDCPICKKMFAKQFKLKNHIKTVHNVQMEDSPLQTETKRKKCLYCADCARVFWSQTQYDSHNKRIHPDKSALELDKQVMEAMSGEIKTEPADGFSLKEEEFETVKHKCEFCSKVHWTKKLFDEHMLKEHPEHADEYGISASEDISRPTIEVVNDSQDMMGNLLSVGLYDVSACDKLSSLPVVSIQRINGKFNTLLTSNNGHASEQEPDVEMEAHDSGLRTIETEFNIETFGTEMGDKLRNSAGTVENSHTTSDVDDVGCLISSVKTLQEKETENMMEEMSRKPDESCNDEEINENKPVVTDEQDSIKEKANMEMEENDQNSTENDLNENYSVVENENSDEDIPTEEDTAVINTDEKDVAVGSIPHIVEVEKCQLDTSERNFVGSPASSSDGSLASLKGNNGSAECINKNSVVIPENDVHVKVSNQSEETCLEETTTTRDCDLSSEIEMNDENAEEESENEQECIDWEAIDNEIKAVVDSESVSELDNPEMETEAAVLTEGSLKTKEIEKRDESSRGDSNFTDENVSDLDKHEVGLEETEAQESVLTDESVKPNDAEKKVTNSSDDLKITDDISELDTPEMEMKGAEAQVSVVLTAESSETKDHEEIDEVSRDYSKDSDKGNVNVGGKEFEGNLAQESVSDPTDGINETELKEPGMVTADSQTENNEIMCKLPESTVSNLSENCNRIEEAVEENMDTDHTIDNALPEISTDVTESEISTDVRESDENQYGVEYMDTS